MYSARRKNEFEPVTEAFYITDDIYKNNMQYLQFYFNKFDITKYLRLFLSIVSKSAGLQWTYYVHTSNKLFPFCTPSLYYLFMAQCI